MTIPRDLSNLAPGANTSGVLQSSKGGTGLTSPGTSGNVLTSNGTAWVSSTIGGSGGATATGNVTLTSSSSGSQSITTTAYGQTVTLPNATTMSKSAMLFNIKNNGNYDLRITDFDGNVLGFVVPLTSVIVGLADNSTTAGTWTIAGAQLTGLTAQLIASTLYNSSIVESITLSSTSLLIVYSVTSVGIYAVAYDATTNSFGTPTLIRSTASGTIIFRTIKINTTQALLFSSQSTSMEAVVLTVSGTSVSIGTAATKTLIGTPTVSYNSILIGSTYIWNFGTASAKRIIGVTVSGTTATIGSEQNGTSSSSSLASQSYIYAASSTLVLVSLDTAAFFLYVDTFTVSGTTITAVTSASTACDGTNFRISSISSGARYAVIYRNAGATLLGSIISISGTTPSISTATLIASGVSAEAAGATCGCIASGSKLIVMETSSRQFNILTDTSGTASAGTALTGFFSTSYTNVTPIRVDGSNAVFTISISGAFLRISIDFSSTSPSLSSMNQTVASGGTGLLGNLINTVPYDRLYLPSIIQNTNFSLAIGGNGAANALINKDFVTYSLSASPYIIGTNVGTAVVGINTNERIFYTPNYGTGTNAGILYKVEGVQK